MSQVNSADRFLLDTHIWVRYINGSRLLRPASIAVIEAARLNSGVFVSVLSVWEIAMLVKKGKLALPLSVRAWTEQALRLDGVRLLPLTPESLIKAVEYSNELNADPSDRILLASAHTEELTFLTADKDILRFASKQQILCLKA